MVRQGEAGTASRQPSRQAEQAGKGRRASVWGGSGQAGGDGGGGGKEEAV